jgi:hypothetical protein
MRTLAVILMISFNFAGNAQNPIASFRGWEWGTQLNTVMDQLEPSAQRVAGFKSYIRKGDCKTFEGVMVGETTYLFKKDMLAGILVNILPNEYEKIAEILSDELGQPRKVVSTKYEQLIWNNSGAMVELLLVEVKPHLKRLSVKIMSTQ